MTYMKKVRAHLTISCWHLLINMKSNYLLKKQLEWANKKHKNFNIYNVVLKREKKNTWRYHCFTPVYQKSWWYDLQFLRYRALQTETGNFGSFFALLPPSKAEKSKFWEKKKKKSSWRYHHFTHVYQKSSSYDVWFLRYGISQTECFDILGHFLHSP